MARHVFYSLHYDADRARVELIRKLAILTPNLEATPAEWTTLKRTGDFAIKRWLEQQLRGRSCMIVLIGQETAARPYVIHEIERAIALKMGLIGVHVHHLKDAQSKQSEKGPSPFERVSSDLQNQASRVRVYDPPETDSKLAYRHIADNLARWVETAVADQVVPPG